MFTTASPVAPRVEPAHQRLPWALALPLILLLSAAGWAGVFLLARGLMRAAARL